MNRVALLFVLAALVAGCSGAAPSAPPGASATPVTVTSPTITGSASPAPTATPDLPTELRAILGSEFNGSVLVARDGEILFAEGLGMADASRGVPNSPETRFRLGSVSKQFTAMAILLLDADGALQTRDAACDYLDGCPEAWRDITIEQLIAHTSGIVGFTELPGFDSTRAATPAETVASVADLPLQWTPGEFYGYSNTGYVLLGMIVEQVSGMSYEAFLDQRIFGPLGMDDSGYEHGDTPGLAVGYTSGFEPAAAIDMSVPYAAGGLYSTVLDLQRWDEALDTDELLSAPYRERFFTALVDTTNAFGFGYAYGVMVGDDRGHRMAFHAGGIDGFRTTLARWPDDRIAVVLLTNREDSPELPPLAAALARAVRART